MFPQEDSCWGRHGDAAIVAPDVVLVVVKRYRKRLNCLKSLPGYLTLVSDKAPSAERNISRGY